MPKASWGSIKGWAFTLGVLLLFSPPAGAQKFRTGLTGTVTDPSGAVLPDALVVALQSATGLQRQITTAKDGSYNLPELPVGLYTVTFSHPGFRTLVFQNVQQAIESTRTLNASLQVSAGKEQVEVTAGPVELDQTNSTIGTRIERKQVTQLPLNGRNWATLTALVPTAVDAGGSNQRTVRFAGRGRDDNNFTYDGIDATNIINQAQPTYVRLAIPTETIQEFRVDTMLSDAETGATAGGQVALTSVSGTNQVHGDVFEFLRNDVFDAREPIDALNPNKPPFHLDQFGGSLGGPIVKDKTFFFVSYEGYRQNLGQTLVGLVPSLSFRSQVIAQSPELAPIVNAYPVGQTPVNSTVDQFVSQGNQIVREDSGTFRFDQRFSDNTSAFVRAVIDRATSDVPLASSGEYLNGRTVGTSGPVNAAIELLHSFSPSTLNEVIFGFNRGTSINTNLNQTGSVYAVSVSDLTSLTNNRISSGVGISFSIIDNATLIRGPHALKFGMEVRRIQLNQGTSASGTISYASTDAFAANQVNTATLTGELPVNGLRKFSYYGYVQDEYKWRPNLTLNLGLRYNFFNIFHEVQGRAIPFDFDTRGPQGFCGAGRSFGQPNYLDLDPRLAVAWSPAWGQGNTVIRSGFGIYHEDGQLEDQNLPESNEVQRFSLSSASIPDLSYPIDPFLAGTTGIVSPRDQNRNRKDAYVSQWGLSVQQALGHQFVAMMSYVGSKGTHLLTTSYINVIDPATGTRPYPDFGQVEYRGNDNNSFYHGMVLSLQRSFHHGLLVSGNYTWSHEIDDGSDGSGDGDANFPQNVNCHACERASGNFDVRHYFNANAIYELPFGTGKAFLNQPGVLRSIFGSWQLTTIFLVRTGFPVNFNVDRSASDVPDGNTVNQRPDLVPGVSLAPEGGSSPFEYLNPAAFAVPAPGTFGNTPRNYGRGPGFWQTDFGVSKFIAITERVQLQARAEAFNIFNRAQYGSPQADISSSSFGQILAPVNTGPVGSGTPRQVQFGLRVAF